MTLVFLLGSNLNIFSEDQGSPRCSSWYLAISFWWNLPSGLLCLCLASVYILSLRWPKHWAFFGQEVINQAFMVDRHHKTPDILLHGKGRVSLSDTLFCFFSSHYQIVSYMIFLAVPCIGMPAETFSLFFVGCWPCTISCLPEKHGDHTRSLI